MLQVSLTNAQPPLGGVLICLMEAQTTALEGTEPAQAIMRHQTPDN